MTHTHTHTRHTQADNLQAALEACPNGKSFLPFILSVSKLSCHLKKVLVYKAVILQIVRSNIIY